MRHQNISWTHGPFAVRWPARPCRYFRSFHHEALQARATHVSKDAHSKHAWGHLKDATVFRKFYCCVPPCVGGNWSPSSKFGPLQSILHKHVAKSRLISVDPQNLMNWPRVPPPLDSLPTMTPSPRYFLGLRACTCLGASWALCPDASALPSGAMEWLKHANQTIFQGVSNLNKLKDGWNTTVFCSQGGWKDDLWQRCNSNPQSVHPCWHRLKWPVYVSFDVQVLQEFSAHDAAAFCWVGMSQSASHVVIQRLQRGKCLCCHSNRNSIVDVLLKWWVRKDIIYRCWF